MKNKLTVCLDARLISGASGGVEQVVLGMASGLSGLSDGDEEYLFLTYKNNDEWLRPHVSGSCRILSGPQYKQEPRWIRLVKTRLPLVWDSLNNTKHLASFGTKVPESDGTIENTGIHIMHFLFQSAFLTNVPSIYHPHDLQHIHFPQFFTLRERLARDLFYKLFCNQSIMISVVSNYAKKDLIKQYEIAEDKIKVVPWAPPLDCYPIPTEDDLDRTSNRYSLPTSFIFYPAETWPHKNHIRLLEALAILRDRVGLQIPLVSSGRKNDFFPAIEKRINELNLMDQTTFLGYVSNLELHCLFKLCRCVVIPTKFEAGSFPLWEGFAAGKPTACSNVTSLPEQAGDAALLFDPDNPEEIANAIFRLWTDSSLCNALIQRGRKNVSRYSWNKTARIFRAHYRRIAGRQLTEDDLALLETKPIW